ncbi:MAG: hypothetical protein AB7P21_17615 [Lautropia sp.]
MSDPSAAALEGARRQRRVPGLSDRAGRLARRLCYALQGRLPTRHISHAGAPYLERSYVATLFGVRIYLHRFVACDEDGVHDHPFRHAASLILAGWYWEDQWASRRKQRWFNRIGPNKLHRVVLPEASGADVWTLFLHSPRVKPWGVMRSVDDGPQGPALRYEPQSDPDDPTHSTWHRRAPTGRALRADPARNISGPAFDIPLGLNAYSAGLARYPESARRHALAATHGACVARPDA